MALESAGVQDMLDSGTWKDWLLRDRFASWDALEQLQFTDATRYGEICHALAADEDIAVAEIGLRHLAYFGERDDAESDAIARAWLRHSTESIHDIALLALGSVGLASAYALIATYVSSDNPCAFVALVRQARTSEQHAESLQFARDFLFSANIHMRNAAARVLLRWSTVHDEERLLLKSASEHLDYLTLRLLHNASARVVPQLKELQANLREDSDQWRYVTEAIQAIEQPPSR